MVNIFEPQVHCASYAIWI